METWKKLRAGAALLASISSPPIPTDKIDWEAQSLEFPNLNQAEAGLLMRFRLKAESMRLTNPYDIEMYETLQKKALSNASETKVVDAADSYPLC
jgi:hypothetical protein